VNASLSDKNSLKDSNDNNINIQQGGQPLSQNLVDPAILHSISTNSPNSFSSYPRPNTGSSNFGGPFSQSQGEYGRFNGESYLFPGFVRPLHGGISSGGVHYIRIRSFVESNSLGAQPFMNPFSSGVLQPTNLVLMSFGIPVQSPSGQRRYPQPHMNTTVGSSCIIPGSDPFGVLNHRFSQVTLGKGSFNRSGPRISEITEDENDMQNKTPVQNPSSVIGPDGLHLPMQPNASSESDTEDETLHENLSSVTKPGDLLTHHKKSGKNSSSKTLLHKKKK
jgi:hypothetical protein